MSDVCKFAFIKAEDFIMAGECGMDRRDWSGYVLQVATAQAYCLDDAQVQRVAAQMALMWQVSQALLSMPLPAELEPAPVFNPVSHL